ncbi:hypothetical protein DID75_01950 [Candidatus Marinamargulisbacteria bacterium SCGC AG-410-N11]|nr:hypothetical protein DID75_01950 [Candidatus Marinamargulisbacteria bacterium SCGC AG-410-N11]
MWEIFLKGGPIMYLLFLCSFLGIYIIIHKFLFLKSHSVNIDKTTHLIKQQLLNHGKSDTIKQLKTKHQIMIRVLCQAITLSALNRDDIQDGIKGITLLEVPKLEKNLSVLSSIITVAPILGLLGTVLGLIDIFNVISGGGIGNTQALSSGIAEALISTVSGLAIAIPLIFVHHFLSHKVNTFTMQMEHLIYDIINFCKSNPSLKH